MWLYFHPNEQKSLVWVPERKKPLGTRATEIDLLWVCLVCQLDEGQLSNGGEIFRGLYDQAQAGTLSVMRSLVEELEHGLREIALTGCRDSPVAKDKRDAKAAIARGEIDDGSLLEFEQEGPAVLG